MKRKINLVGGGFQHTLSTNTHEPKYVEWVKGNFESDITFYIDSSMKLQTNPDTKNFGWLCESRTMILPIYKWCEENIDFLKTKFIKIFTHDYELSLKSDLFQLTQSSGKSFFSDGEIYTKNKLVSMISSRKTLCEEHRYRLTIAEKYKNKCDLFGRGFYNILDKKIGLMDYCFSIAMENGTYSNMFSEKITDCFMTGTIPIYFGIKNIGDYFNTDGIIILDENFDIDSLSFDLYYSKMDAIKENFEIAKNMLVAEDYIYINYLTDV